MIELVALKKCGKYKPGDIFKEQPGKAKLLVAIKSARYMTRDMIADRIPTEKPIFFGIDYGVDEHNEVIQQEIKRGRGRPRLNTNIDE